LAAALAAAKSESAPGAGHGGQPAAGALEGRCSSGASDWLRSPLYELLTVQLPDDLSAPQSCLELLQLLQLLEALNRLGRRLLCHRGLQEDGNLVSNKVRLAWGWATSPSVHPSCQ
jgi:hypothetical protein